MPKARYLILTLLMPLAACSTPGSSTVNWDNMNFTKIICMDDGDVPKNCSSNRKSYTTARAQLSTP